MSFTLHGQSHTLHGDVSLHRTPVSLRSLFRTTNIDYCALLFESEREEVVEKKPILTRAMVHD